MLNLIVKPLDSIPVVIKHPGTGASLGTLIIAGPDHPATVARRRAIMDARQVEGAKLDLEAELRETLAARTIDWEGVQNESGEAMPFDRSALAEVYSQQWLCDQVLDAVRGNEVFFQS
jgi:hypothetical protein